MVFTDLASKPVVTVSSGLASTCCDGFWQFGLKTCCDGFLKFGLKTGGDGFLQFGLRTGGDGPSHRNAMGAQAWANSLQIIVRITND
jgi:hypothetical protein